MTGNIEGTSTDILVNGKFINFLRLFCVSAKRENGNEFYSPNQFLFWCYTKSLGMISREIACAVNVCLCFVVSSVAVISVHPKMKS